jgi:hypothetical protein
VEILVHQVRDSRYAQGKLGGATRLCGLALLLACGACRGEKAPAPPALPELAGWGKARPVDDASKDPSLAAFRDTLLDIARRRDSAALSARLAPTIRFSFGDSRGGPAGFFAHWKKYQSMDKLWTTLADVLEHGGRMRDSVSFMAPWTFTALPDSLDAFEYLVVRDSNVVVQARASSDSAIGTLSFDIVRTNGPPTDSLWRAISLRDGRTGFVESRSIRSPVDYRIGLRKSGGRWMIDFFVAGD